MPADNAANLIAAALQLASAGSAETGVLPSARSAEVVAQLADAGSVEALTASGANMKALTRTLLDWSGPRSTGVCVKAAAAVLGATGNSERYAHGVEALSFAAVCAPLLQPDRIARLLTATLGTQGAYAPIRYPAMIAAKLQALIGHYGEARQEQLLISLWHSAHDGRWWDNTANLGRPRRRRRRGDGETRAEREREEYEAVAATLAGIEHMPASQLVDRVIQGAVAWSPPVAERLANTTVSAADATRIAAWLPDANTVDADIVVLISMLGGLGAAQRPDNPIPTMVETLEFILGEENPATATPKKPSSWSALYPAASLRAYPIPDHILARDGEKLTADDGTSLHVELIRTPHDLHANGGYMGNCTFSYNSRCQNGDWIIAKAHAGGQIYNFSLTRRHDGWTVGEINSRFNGGGVPDVVRNTIGRFAAEL